MTIEKRINELGEKYEKQKEINKDLADCNSRLLSQAAAATKRLVALEKENAELEEELKNWKDEWQEQVQKAIDEGYARTQQTIQLTKAKELLAKWVELYKPKLEGYPITPIQEQTEQFLKEIKK